MMKQNFSIADRAQRTLRPARLIRMAGILSGIVLACGAASAQQANPDAVPDSGAVIRAETKVVLVDAVVTDKKGNYVKNLSQKDFKIWEDNKEQKVSSFSFQSDPNLSKDLQRRFIVLFFDNSTMQPGDQAQARKAATKFIDSNAGPNRMMAIVNFGGAIQLAQNFTSDAERLKQVVNGLKLSAVAPNATDSTTMPAALAKAASDFGANDMILALRSLAKNLNTIAGRKTLILFTEGFPLNTERMSELTATIDTCNKSNVAVYPIDVRGLIGGAPAAHLYAPSSIFPSRGLVASMSLVPSLLFFQKGGGGTGGAGGGGGHGGGTGGGSPGGGGGHGGAPGGPGTGNPGGRGPGAMNPNNLNQMNPLGPNTQARNALIPKMPESGVTNQSMMHMLADGTGGFVIENTNDLFAGLDRIGNELDQYYILGYTPPDSPEGSCHALRVKVDEGGTSVRFRTGYCNAKPQDILAGTSTEKTLESRAAGTQSGTIAATMELPFFYTGPNQARVNVAMEVPANALKFDREKGKFVAEMNVLGIAFAADGAVAARFSDTLRRVFDDKKEVEAFDQLGHFHYENQFDISSGDYNLKVVFSAAGNNFGKIEMPLKVEPWSNQFGLSSIALSKEFHQQSALASLDSSLIEDRTPLIAGGAEVIPYGADKFSKTQGVFFYTEVYEPLMTNADPNNRPVIGMTIRVLDRKTREEKYSTGLMRLDMKGVPENEKIPLAERVPLDQVGPGQYTIEIDARDSAGKTATRTADFDLD